MPCTGEKLDPLSPDLQEISLDNDGADRRDRKYMAARQASKGMGHCSLCHRRRICPVSHPRQYWCECPVCGDPTHVAPAFTWSRPPESQVGK